MLRTLLICASLMMLGGVSQSRPYEAPGTGVALALAEERAARVTNLRYELHFTVPPVQSAPVSGRVTIRFDLKDASRPLALDFAAPSNAVAGATLNGRDGKPEYVTDHLVVAASDLRSGANEITVEFRSADAPLNRSAEFLYALFVPARARQAFPCFDQPDLKARYTLSLDVPAGWTALSNGAEATGDSRGPSSTVRFAETQPISTYLFTFAAGRFTVDTAERDGRRFRMLHRETDAAKVARNRDAIFDLHAGAISWLENYTGIPYPFGKFDFLLVPSFQFGGMEHPGSVYYNAPALMLDESATQNQKLGRASLIAHETAHMWFGDLVTMRWFNDVWMKEVFANFMAAKIVNPAFPEINHDLRFLYAHYPAAYDVDRTAGTNAIRQRLDNLDEAGSMYGAIIYQKAPIVMRQLELLLGAASFRDGMQEYLKAHVFGNATWTDLIATLDRRTPDDLAAWSRSWVEEAGRPIIRVDLKANGEAVESLEVTQEDPITARGLLWTQPLSVAIGYRRDGVGTRHRMTGRALRISSGATVPDYVLPNSDGVSYGNFVLDPSSRAYLLENLPADEVARGSALVILWEEMVDGRVLPRAMFDLLVKTLPTERNELTIQRMLSYLQQVRWRWIPDAERANSAAAVEAMLRAGLNAANTPSLKSAWFHALRDTAQTRSTLAWLEAVWKKTETVPGLVLAEPDFITLAQELAVRGVPGSERILSEQIARTQNPDRKARMEFVRPSLSADSTVRDAFFAQLKDPIKRRREAWVLEGIGYLHHPLRAASAEKHVQPSLEMLLEIQRTGDIFFPKRWMDATLSGHRSPAVAATVTKFLAELPAGYPDRLRRIILSSADDLLRVSRQGRQQ
ncbi:MAG: M1 family aminopeptidase [Acidobacteriota bacterium]|nr:M1 family aminopeptidase [Acidobacteriota bacterium]